MKQIKVKAGMGSRLHTYIEENRKRMWERACVPENRGGTGAEKGRR